MNIALPLTATGEFAAHYGTAAQFIVYEIEPKTRTVRRRLQVHPVENRPCHWPVLLGMAGVDLVLAGGMGHGARQHMTEQGITVLTGVAAAEPEVMVAGWLAGTLITGENICGGGHHEGDGHCQGHAHEHGAGREHAGGGGCTH